MPENGKFHLADSIIAAEKYFDVSLEDILYGHARARKFEVPTTIEIFDPQIGEPVEGYLVLKISGHVEYPESWDAALLLHKVRIDGFGYEQAWENVRGEECFGWHRHKWHFGKGNANAKEPVDCFDSVREFQHFVTTALREMNIKLSGRTNGPDNLFDA